MVTTRHQINCITKSDRFNPHERITEIGGMNPNGSLWKMSQEKAIADIENKTYAFYVSVKGHTVNVIVGTSRYGNKYLKTEADNDQPDNLLSLMECR